MIILANKPMHFDQFVVDIELIVVLTVKYMICCFPSALGNSKNKLVWRDLVSLNGVLIIKKMDLNG